MLNKTTKLLAISTFILSIQNPVYADDKMKIMVGSKELVTNESPYIFNDVTLVPLRSIFEELGAEVKWDEKDKKITAIKNTSHITLKIDSKTAVKNGEPVSLLVPAKIINNTTMVPLRFVSEALGANVYFNPSENKIEITTTQTQEEADINKSLTIDGATDLLIKNSFHLSNANKEIEKLEEIKDNAEEKIDYIPFLYSGNDANSTANKIYYGFQQANLSYEMAKKNYQVEIDKLTHSLLKSYNDILVKENAYKVAELKLEDLVWKSRLSELKEQNGVTSHFELDLSATNVKEAKSNLEKLRVDLENAYQNFDNLIGANSDQRYTLIDSPKFSKLDEVNLENHVTRVVNSSAVVWLAEKKVAFSEIEKKLYTFNDPTQPPYEIKSIEIDIAQTSVADTKKQLGNAIRSIYYNIRSLEEQFEVLNANLAKAENGLKVVQVKYDQGMATEAELLESKVAVEEIKQKMFEVITSLENLKVAFEKPWVMS